MIDLTKVKSDLYISLNGFKSVLEAIESEIDFDADNSFEADTYRVVIEHLSNVIECFEKSNGVKFAYLTLLPMYDFIHLINKHSYVKHGLELEKCFSDVIEASKPIIEIDILSKIFASFEEKITE